MTAAGLGAQGTSASLVATFDGKGIGLVATGAWIAERAAQRSAQATPTEGPLA